MTGLLIATVPLMGAVLYGFVPGMERLDGRRLVGPHRGVRRRRGAGRHRRRADRPARGRRGDRGGALLRDRPADHQPASRRPPGARRDGCRHHDRRHRLRPGRPDAPPAERLRRGDRLRGRPRPDLHGPGLRRVLRAHPRGRTGARDGHHLHQPARRRAPRRGRAERTVHAGHRRRSPPHPGRLRARYPPILPCRRSRRRWWATRRPTSTARREPRAARPRRRRGAWIALRQLAARGIRRRVDRSQHARDDTSACRPGMPMLARRPPARVSCDIA